ncbi:MAG: T9SS type A sorting domain-containing protein [Prolixibacteraceae bacterium]|jgi:pectate lyase|nr:T9SS type A sorting domain-containing protein [Prolixibacteraceae bacterium]
MRKFILLSCILVFTWQYTFAQSLVINEAEGWIESAYVQWAPVDEAESYNVYYSGGSATNVKIDDQLIRDYGSYFRADVLGLKAGNYTLMVKAVIEDEEVNEAETEVITVMQHDRTGFAFSNERVPGAYQLDGTHKDNAVIIYITENTKNTISLEVTGANTNPCVGIQTILEGFKKGKDNRPLIVRLVGQITDPSYLDKGDIVIENDNNSAGYITLEGVGDDATADGWGIRVKNASNIEIRNIGFMNCDSNEGDDVSLQQDNEYVWVHHCDFFYGNAGGDSDQAKGDGALDCKRSGFVTFSYNHFWDTGKSNLLGNGIEDPRFLTYHHNWYDHSDSRHPRVRSHSVHVYNNYYDGIAKYGVGATNASSVFVEGNYFRNCKYPILTSMQGSDVYDESKQANDYSDMPTFSKEDGGSIKAFNNYMIGHRRFVAYGDEAYSDPTTDFDAYVAETRNEEVPGSVVSDKGDNRYNNFDTDEGIMYKYIPDSPEEAKDKVQMYAGRMNGGDFKWVFDNAKDDADYAVNPALKQALVTYKTQLIAVQADGEGNDPGDDDDPDEITGNVVHNFTTDGIQSTFFAISGNLSDSKGTVTYGGQTLTQCLKIESSTNVAFTTIDESLLTLVFNNDFTGEIKINGTSYTAVAGIVSVGLSAGTHVLSKDDVANLFLIKIEYQSSTSMLNSNVWIKTFPNPVQDILHIASSERISEIKLYSTEGVVVKHYTGDLGYINFGELQRGVYFIKILAGDASFTKRVVKY